MKYKTASYLRTSGSLLALAGPGRPGAWERDCRNGSPAAGSEAIEMRAGPVGRLAGEVGQAEGAPRAQAKARQEAARKLPVCAHEQASWNQPDASCEHLGSS